jgi:hypothetical protein
MEEGKASCKKEIHAGKIRCENSSIILANIHAFLPQALTPCKEFVMF